MNGKRADNPEPATLSSLRVPRVLPTGVWLAGIVVVLSLIGVTPASVDSRPSQSNETNATTFKESAPAETREAPPDRDAKNVEPAELKVVRKALAPIWESLDPKPKIEYRNYERSLMVTYRPQLFKIHSRSMTGEISADAHDEIGPSYKGFVLKVFLQDRGEGNQAVTPQTIREPYWLADLDVTPIGKTRKQVFWALSYGSRMDKKMLDSIRSRMKALRESPVNDPP